MLSLLAVCFIVQCGPGGCGAPRPAHLVVECPADARLFVDGHEVRQTGRRRRLITPPLPAGGRYGYLLRLVEGERELARRSVEFAAGETVAVSFAAAETAEPNFGLDLPALKPAGKISLNGRAISKEEALRLLGRFASPTEVASGIPDDGAKRRLTVIGAAEACAAVVKELEGPLREFALDFTVKSYRPQDWAVAKAGFKTDGAPTIYAQEADGKVLFRQDDPGDLKKNLEAVRKPHPDYRPERDPDYRKTAPDMADPDSGFALFCMALAGALLFARRAA